MRRPRSHVVLALVPMLTCLTLGVGLSSPAAAHEERPATFPDGSGHRPTFLGLDNPRHRVVCRPGTGRRIAQMQPGALKRRNEQLLGQCRFGSIQTAINSIKRRHTSIYVLPGYYTEHRWATAKRSAYCSDLKSASDDPLDVAEYIGSLTSPDSGAGTTGPIALSYPDQVRCAHNLNLIALFGDRTPHNASIRCDSRFCGTQLVGTGRSRRAVTIDNRFHKLNAIRADRAGGVYFRNFTVQQAEFNSLYVMESDGFVVDRVVARANDEYGVLTFASDHGLVQHVDAYYNGDSGIYPGSGADINADNNQFKPTRYAIEIRDSRSHHNMLGYSGTAGNSVWAHDNSFYANSTGIATDSLFPGHPGLPQDHARWSHNRIHGNNSNYYTRYVDSGVCDRPIRRRGYLEGTVCPVIPTPVGTGLLIAGGNYDSTDHNWIYDNWRYGTMQFWAPSPLRDEYDPSKLYDTSNHNRSFENKMGFRPDGTVAHNGMDFWWDDQGVGNCWENNTSSRGTPTNNFVVHPGPCADGGSQFIPGTSAVKDAGFLSCNEYDRSDPIWHHPPGCTWFDSPSKPSSNDDSGPVPMGASAGPPSGGGSGLGGGGSVAALGAGAAILLGAATMRRRTALVTSRG